MENNYNNKNNNQVVVKDIGQKAITSMLNQVVSYAEMEQQKLTPKEKQYAVGIITQINKKISSDNTLSWQVLDIKGCQLPAQIKRFARLNLQLENNEIWLDIRNNKNTGLKDINIKMQYQGVEKYLVNYCSKKIIRFAKDVICKGDVIDDEVDLTTGITKLTKHKKFETDEVDYRNKLENITGAYAIAYAEENGEIIPYVAMIDKNRIEKARKSAPTQAIWNADTKKMVIKTAVWELLNIMKPFMNAPQDIVKDFEDATSGDVDFNNKDYINADVNEVNDNVEKNIGSVEMTNSFQEQEVDEPQQPQYENQETGEVNNIPPKSFDLYDED